jgi:ankyrin repeat protein
MLAGMIRLKPILVLVGLLTGLASAPTALWGQVPPSPSELKVYAGLHAAAAKGDVAEIEQLIRDGEKPNLQDSRSRTPLHVAAHFGRHDAARALLRLGANPNALDHERYDIITIAAVKNDLEMLRIALENGGNPRAITSPYEGTALIAAAHRGNVEAVRLLIAAGAPLDHVNNQGWTALIEAVVLGNGDGNHTATVEALAKAGADPNVADRQKMTALAHARARRYGDMIRILQAAGAL